jgi:hypothetical protein
MVNGNQKATPKNNVYNYSRNKPVTVGGGRPKRLLSTKRKNVGASRITKTKLAEAVCSQTDAFCPHAKDAKIYDIDSSRTLTAQLRTTIPIVNNGSGKSTTQISGSLAESYRVASAWTGSLPTSWGSNTPVTDFTSIDALASRFRIVSWGVRIQSNCNTNAATGLAYVQVCSAKSDIDYKSIMVTEALVTPILGCDVTILCTPMSSTYTSFVPMSQAASAAGIIYPTIVVSTAGENSVSALVIEVVYNIEYIPLVALANMATPANPYNPTVTAMTSYLQGVTPAIYDMGMNMVTRQVKNLATSAATSYLGPAAGMMFATALN